MPPPPDTRLPRPNTAKTRVNQPQVAFFRGGCIGEHLVHLAEFQVVATLVADAQYELRCWLFSPHGSVTQEMVDLTDNLEVHDAIVPRFGS